MTLFRGCFDASPLGVATIGEVLQAMQSPDAKTKQLHDKLKQLHGEDASAYTKLKEKNCPAFLIGEWGGKTDEALQTYVPLLGFDVDASESEMLAIETIKQLRADPFIFAAYLSPSSAGLRFLVWTDATPETHKSHYAQIAEYYGRFLNIPTDKQLRAELREKKMSRTEIAATVKRAEHIDTGCSNTNRLWFYTAPPAEGFYYNPDAAIFKMTGSIAEQMGGKPSADSSAPLDDAFKVRVCRAKVDRQDVPAGRNNYVYALACELARHGVTEAYALAECSKEAEPGFSAAEIEKSVRSAYKTHPREFDDPQVRRYAAMIEGKTTPPRGQQTAAKGKKAAKPSSSTEQPSAAKTAAATPDADSSAKRSKFVQMRDYIRARHDLRMNTVSLEVEASPKGRNVFEPLNENDLICELMEVGFTGVETPLIALLKSSRYAPRYDPLNGYFENLPSWTPEQGDHIAELASYIETNDDEFFGVQFRKMLVRAVACAIGRIPFAKQCMVFKGKQNDGKTSFVRYLCPPALKDYYTDTITLHDKDGRLALCNNFIINIDELGQFTAKELALIKSLISLASVKERLPYDRKPSRIERRASFFASTNDDEFLTDSTGNVRWLIFGVKSVNHDNGGPNGYMTVDINAVWAQAYALLKSGYGFEMTKDELKQSERQNVGYQVSTVEQELIQERFAPASKDEDGARHLTGTEILTVIRDVIKTATLRNVGRALKLLGFEVVQKYDSTMGRQKRGVWVKDL